MGAKKIKIAKKDALKKEETALFSERVKDWLNDHYRVLGGIVIGVFLVLILAWGFNAYGEAKERRARGDYAQVLKTWPDEDNADPKAWERVAPELEKFIGEYEGTRPALNAQLDLSRAYYQMGKYEESIKWGTRVLEKLSSKDELGPLAMYQLAMTYQASGDIDRALEQWSALKAQGFSENSREIDWYMARLYAKKGDQAKARDHYEQALKASGSYPGTAVLEEELASLGIKSKAGS